MAKKEKDQVTLPAPRLKAPLESDVVDGAEVVFVWEPVEGALEYQLEVAADTSFDEIVLERMLGPDVSSQTVQEAFPTDGQTFFWRVLARNENGWSSGDHVESFVSVSAAEATDVPVPDRREERGPVSELVKAASVEAAAETTRKALFYEEEHGLGVEHDRIEAGQIVGLAGAVIVAIIMAIIVIFQWTDVRYRAQRNAVVGLSGYPELREARARAAELLTQYDVVEEGVYRIPIQRAMELIAAETYENPADQYTSEVQLLPPEQRAGQLQEEPAGAGRD